MQLYFLYLSRRLWQVVLGLAAMPLCALVAAVLLTFQKYESAAVNTLTMNHGLVVLPFVLLTSTVLLSAVLILADHERLERASQLAGLREICYQGLQRSKRFCDNEAANVVLSAKAEVMEQEGITADFAVSLPKELSVADTDLAALLGNALDNAIEGVQNAPTKKVILCCSVDKGLLMLRLENPLVEKSIRIFPPPKRERPSTVSDFLVCERLPGSITGPWKQAWRVANSFLWQYRTEKSAKYRRV